jgi:hypothetical protein
MSLNLKISISQIQDNSFAAIDDDIVINNLDELSDLTTYTTYTTHTHTLYCATILDSKCSGSSCMFLRN